MGYTFSKTNNGVKASHTNGSYTLLKSISSIETIGTTGISIRDTRGVSIISIEDISSIDLINGVAASGTLSGVIDQFDVLFKGNQENSVKTVSDEFTRPADIVAYAVKDVVGDGTVRSFTIGDVNGQSGIIKKAILISNDKTLAGQFRVHIYNTAITAIADNTSNTILYANKESYVGFIDFAAMATEDTASTASFSISTGLNIGYVLASSDTRLYYVLETLSVFTPVASTAFYIELESTIPA